MRSSASAAEATAASSLGRRRALVSLLLVFLTAAAIVAAMPGLRVAVQHAGLMAAGDPIAALDRQITTEFGMQNPVVWIIEAPQGTIWTPSMLARIRDFTREVFTIPGVIAPDVIGLASPNMRGLTVTNGAMRPEYLMAEVPTTPAATEQLRLKVEGDPNYRGTLVSEDGTAAMVVANFRSDADLDAVGRAALALRDRYRDASTRVYATGAPVMGIQVPGALPPLAASLALVVLVALLSLTIALGVRAAAHSFFAAMLACVWTVVSVAIAGEVSIPWTLYALFPTAILAAAMAVMPMPDRPAASQFGVGALLAIGFAVLAAITGPPVRAFGVAGAAGALCAIAAGAAVRRSGDSRGSPVRSVPRLRLAAAVCVVVAALGLPRVHTSFGLPAYAEHYLPAAAVEDLHAMVRHFPPPTSLAIRMRGEPGFVQSPEVLTAMDGVVEAVREDPAVSRAMSLADVVKMVHRAFNDNREDFLVIPRDRGLITRYLLLAYSPMFRRFVDRAFKRSAIWVYASSDRPADLARIEGRIEAQLAAHPVPNAEVDPIAGDGALLLVMANQGERLALGSVALLLLAAFGMLGYGLRAAGWWLAGGLSAAGVAAGAGGWLGVPLDLVSLPVFVAAAAAGATVAALAALWPAHRWDRAAAGIAAAAVPALLLPFTAAHLVGLMLLGPAVGLGLAAPRR